MPDPSNLDQRLQAFRNMLAAEPENELLNLSLAKLLVEKGDDAAAERALRKALTRNERLSVAIELLGALLLRTGRRDEAAELLARGVRTAHEAGEYQPRNRMQELLRGIGVTPPDPAGERAAAAAPRDSTSAGWSCRRCGLDDERLQRPPFASDLGKRIAASICARCWEEWKRDISVKVINELRLDLSTAAGAAAYDREMKAFLGLADE
jgi:Fe-S cluster biosynthesis and repair protein YggX